VACTNDELVESTKCQEARIIRISTCAWNGAEIGRKAVSDSTGKDVLSEFLDLMSNDAFECVSTGKRCS